MDSADSLPSIYIDSIADEQRKNVGVAEVGRLFRTMWISLMCTDVKLGKEKRLSSQYLFSFCV